MEHGKEVIPGALVARPVGQNGSSLVECEGGVGDVSVEEDGRDVGLEIKLGGFAVNQ